MIKYSSKKSSKASKKKSARRMEDKKYDSLDDSDTITYDKKWGYLDAQFITRCIFPLDEKTAILIIDVDDDEKGTNKQTVVFRTNYETISHDYQEIELNDGETTIMVDSYGGGSLEFIGADFEKLATGETILRIATCYNYCS